MRVEDKIRKPIAFIGRQVEGNFVASGTGFFAATFIDERGFQQVITAKHVIDNIPSDLVDIRLNTHAGTSRILKTKKEQWHPHPDKNIDVSVFPCVISKEEFDFLHIALEGEEILTDAVIKARNIGVGDEVIISGMYIARIGEEKNISIVRTGTIAAMTGEKLRTEYGYHHAYLVEARSIDGLSGSPVYVQLQPWRIQDGQAKLLHGHYEYLMGIILGHAQVTNPGDTIEIVQSDIAREEGEPKRQFAPLNTGIGVVLPISYVVEAVNQPQILEARKASLIKGKGDRRFVADSVSSGERGHQPSDGNPKHREDFTSLLNAAAKKLPQDD